MRSKDTRKIVKLMLICTAMLGLLAGCGTNTASDKTENTANENSSEQLPQSTEINAWGEVKYNTAYQMMIDFPSTVTSVEVKEGDRVHKDAVLALLNIDEFNKTIARLEAQKSAGEAALSGITQSVEGLTAQITQQKKEVETAQKDLDNAKILYEEGGISKREYDQFVSGLDAQRTALKVLQTQLEQVNKSNSSNYAQQSSSNTAIQKEIEIYRGRLNKPYLKDNQIVSPIENAIVKSIQVENGAVVGSDLGQKVVMELIDEDSLYISAEVEEEFIGKITMQTPVRIVPTMNSELEFSGSISQIAALAVEKDGSRIVKVQIIPDDAEKMLKVGYTVDVYFES